MVTSRLRCWLAALSMASCREPVNDNLSHLDEPRILAVRATPAEAAPGEEVSYEVLYADGTGLLDATEVSWAFCIARKPLDELGPVNDRCLGSSPEWLVPFGRGAIATAPLPADGCQLFGPDRPPPADGQAAGRPVDPDPTGGHFQPVQVRAGGAPTTMAATRIRCGLAGAKPELVSEYGERYRSNTNPAISRVTIAGVEVDGSARIVFEPGSTEVGVAWPGCGDEACEGAETYLWYDTAEQTLALRREGIRVSWFTTLGTFSIDHTGRAEEEADQAASRNVLMIDDQAAVDFTILLVIRDDRGGVGWRAFDATTSRP